MKNGYSLLSGTERRITLKLKLFKDLNISLTKLVLLVLVGMIKGVVVLAVANVGHTSQFCLMP